ncbi:Lrp/AsnC ligand binding domain-containing protein [Halosegnis sp.]|uniref:Lrp/AsnC ligand binding domain-containing protein n=1 Tax=Halosegnis sp. TaxID=2864959 RepID=UPI0035D52B49
MVRAYVMIDAGAGDAAALLDGVLAVDRVEEAHVVAGDYDIIAEVTAEEVGDVMSTVATTIRNIEGVTDTRTYVCLA